MSDNGNPGSSIARRLSRNPGEHVLNVFKAALASAPFLGGIASLMTDYIPSSKQRRLEDFAKQIASDLSAVKDKVDEAVFFTDEFAFVFEQCFRGVSENYQAEKLDSFRGILVNTAIGTAVSNDEREYFLGLVGSLSALHLRILSFMSDPIAYLNARNIPKEQIRGGFSDFFRVAIPGVSIDVIRSAFGDLHRAGLINTDSQIFVTMTSSSGLDLLSNRVSGLGHAFVAFCKSPAEIPLRSS